MNEIVWSRNIEKRKVFCAPNPNHKMNAFRRNLNIAPCRSRKLCTDDVAAHRRRLLLRCLLHIQSDCDTAVVLVVVVVCAVSRRQ